MAKIIERMFIQFSISIYNDLLPSYPIQSNQSEFHQNNESALFYTPPPTTTTTAATPTAATQTTTAKNFQTFFETFSVNFFREIKFVS